MYTLKHFCNTIARARRNKGWTQAEFAEKLHISAQSISKWECGIGYPDVSLFPEIAEALGVTMEVLFGKEEKEEPKMNYAEEFEKGREIKILTGNLCQVKVLEGEREKTLVEAAGDPTFLAYFSAEKEGETLRIEVKNPTGSAVKWEAYDRGGYLGENLVRVYTGRENDGKPRPDGMSVTVVNYLNLRAVSHECFDENWWAVDFLAPEN